MTTTASVKDVTEKALAGERITYDEGVLLFKEAPLLELGNVAQEIRYRHNPKSMVTFVIDTNLNYTNVCDAYCTFCAFYRTEKDEDAYTHSVDEMMEMVGHAAAKGVTTVLLQGGLNPKLPMEYYEELVRETRRRYPQILPHYFSAPEIQKMSQVSGLPIAEVSATAEGRGTGDAARRRLRDTVRPREAEPQPPVAQGQGGRLVGRTPGSAQARLSHHRHHDVRPPGAAGGRGRAP